MNDINSLTMDKVAMKIDALKFNFVKYCLPLLLLKHFFLIVLNYYFSNLLSVFAGAIFMGIVLGIYLSYLFSPNYHMKLTSISCVLFLFFDLIYGFLNHTASLFLYMNIFLFPWILYMFYSLRKTIFITCSTMLVYPADAFFGRYFQLAQQSRQYESYTLACLLFFNLALLILIVYYGTEINKYNAILFFETEKTLHANRNSEQKREIEAKVNISFQRIFEKVDLYMKTQEPWRNPDYSLEQLAQDLRLSVIQISSAVNYSTKNNFKSYLNDYRLNAFVEEIKNHESKDFLMKELYMDLGFNSRATFNRNFKTKFRKTPQEFVAMHVF